LKWAIAVRKIKRKITGMKILVETMSQGFYVIITRECEMSPHDPKSFQMNVYHFFQRRLILSKSLIQVRRGATIS
jgi:hypothetical protein